MGMKLRMPEYIEGSEAWTRFRGAMKKALSVPHSEIQRRIEEQRKLSEANPNRRGPKRKIKPSVSPEPSA
jgi:hypothetical protein